MRPILAAALLLTAAACAEPAETPAPAPAPADDRAEAPAPAPDDPDPAPPAQTAEHRFVGRWAVNADFCDQYAWTFAQDHIDTPGEVFCRWNRVEETPAGYVLHGTCTGEAETKPDQVRIDFDGPDAMTVAADVWSAPTRLIRCPPEG